MITLICGGGTVQQRTVGGNRDGFNSNLHKKSNDTGGLVILYMRGNYNNIINAQ